MRRSRNEFFDGFNCGKRWVEIRPVFSIQISVTLTGLKGICAVLLGFVFGCDRSCGTGKTGVFVRALFNFGRLLIVMERAAGADYLFGL